MLAAVFAAVAAASAGEGMGKSEEEVVAAEVVVLRAVTMPEMVGLAWLSTLM